MMILIIIVTATKIFITTTITIMIHFINMINNNINKIHKKITNNNNIIKITNKKIIAKLMRNHNFSQIKIELLILWKMFLNKNN